MYVSYLVGQVSEWICPARVLPVEVEMPGRSLSGITLSSALALLTAASTVGSTGAAWAAPSASARDTSGPELTSIDELADTASAADDADDDGDAETATVAAVIPVGTSTGPRYTVELTDADLAAFWKGERARLGSISMGANDFGRVVNGVPFPEDPRWVVVDPPNTYGTRETVDFMVAVLEEVHRLQPTAPPIRVNHISAPAGGYLRPHRSHQLGRDVDLGLYWLPGSTPRSRTMDLALNWVLFKTVILNTDVEVVLLDKRLIKALHQYAVSIGEDQEWLDRVFGKTGRALIQHARGHRDHFHVRFYNARAQELGWRVQPLLTQDETVPQVVRHRIRSGDNLGRIAQRYGVSISAIKKLNRMRSNFLRAGQSLAIPVRGTACERCPTMARVIVPPRTLPTTPAVMVAMEVVPAGTTAAMSEPTVVAAASLVGPPVPVELAVVPVAEVAQAIEPVAAAAPVLELPVIVTPAAEVGAGEAAFDPFTRRGLVPALD